MTSMQYHMKPATVSASAEKQLFDLQIEQHHHDEQYHREIARLSLHARLNHMALHFAKYAGKIAASDSQITVRAVYVDVLIIALSTANILNLKLWEAFGDSVREHEFPSLLAFGRSLGRAMDLDIRDYALLLKATAIAAGRVAAACEKIDHLEDVPYRAEIRHGIAELALIGLSVISQQGLDPVQAVRERLANVKQRLVLHNRV
jgi:hypothetical protein